MHSGKHSYSNSNTVVLSDITVFNDDLGLYGKADCIELHKCRNGISIMGTEGHFKVCIIEYKPTACKNKPYRLEDAIQVYAQKVCIDKIFSCDCDGYLYYSDTRRRVQIPFGEEAKHFDQLLRETLTQVRSYKEKGEIPPQSRSKKCNGCSLKCFCLPTSHTFLVHKQILSVGGEP